MNFTLRPVALGLAIAGTSTAFLAPAAHAGGTINIDDTKSISIGAGLRTSFNSVEDGAPDGDDRSKNFAVDSIRLYVNGKVHQNIGFEFNTERQDDGVGDDDVRVLDAVAKVQFSDMFNVWMGRFLPPSDRSNLDGPYYLNTWNFPLAQAYPAIFAGRDDGAAVWGQMNGGQFKYQVGVFEGTEGLPNADDSLLWAGRLTLNLWDPEPGYYNSSTYYGGKEILAFGLAYQTQEDATTNPVTLNAEDFTGMSVDALLETTLAGGGVASVEAAYYDYESFGGLGDVDADGYFVLGAYLMPGQMGIGRLQPVTRYQSLDVEGFETTNWELGVNYIIDGHNAKASLMYGNTDIELPGGNDVDFDSLQLGLQFQI